MRGKPRKLDKAEQNVGASIQNQKVSAFSEPEQKSIDNELTDLVNTEGALAVESPDEEELFDDLDDVPRAEVTLFDAAPTIQAVQPPAPETIADADLEDEAKRELARLLNETFSLPERARLLVKLAHHTDTKRAPVALRAIAEVNALTGITRERPADTMPMFQLPDGANVAIVVEKVVK